MNGSGDDPIVSATGKASRELFENQVANGKSHEYDFLTVGSMGHSSSFALVLPSTNLIRKSGVLTVMVLCFCI